MKESKLLLNRSVCDVKFVNNYNPQIQESKIKFAKTQNSLSIAAFWTVQRPKLFQESF